MKIEFDGGKLRHLRAAPTRTLEAVALELGVSRAAVSAWERGIAQPRPELAARLTDGYQVTVKDLVRALRVGPVSRDEWDEVAEYLGCRPEAILP